MKMTIKLINRTEDSFARLLLADGSTIAYTDPQEAENMLKMFFGLNEMGLEAYYNGPIDKSWEHTEFKAQYHHAS